MRKQSRLATVLALLVVVQSGGVQRISAALALSLKQPCRVKIAPQSEETIYEPGEPASAARPSSTSARSASI
jgi:hypothetical protein